MALFGRIKSKLNPDGKVQSRLVIRNIGLLLSGDLQKPILGCRHIVAVDGKITAIGKGKDVDTEQQPW